MSSELPALITWAALPPTGLLSTLSVKVTHLLLPQQSVISSFKNDKKTHSDFLLPSFFLPSAPQYVSPFSVDSNLTVIWLDWTGSFSLNGYLKEYSVTESQLRIYTGFYSYLHVPRISQKSKSNIQHT